MTNYTKQVFRSTAGILFVMLLTAGLGYVWRVVLARKLSVEEFGLFFAVFSLVNLIYGFKGFGLGSGVVRFITEARLSNDQVGVKKILNSYFIIQLAVFGTCSFLMLLFSHQLATHYFKTPTALPLIFVLSIAFVFTIVIQTINGLVHGYQRMIELSTIEFMQSFLLLIATVGFLYFGAGFLSPAYAYAASFILTAGWCVFLALRAFPLFRTHAPVIEKDAIKKLLGFGAYVIFGSISYSVILNFGTVALTYFSTLKDVAYYSVAFPLANVLRFIPRAITMTMLPIASELDITNKAKLNAGITKLYTYLVAGMTPLALVLVLAPATFIKLLFGKEYLAGVQPLQILAIGMIFTSIYMVNQYVLLGIKQPKEFSKMVVAGGVFTVIFSVLLTPFFGMTGTAFAFLLSAIFTAAYSLWQLLKITHSRIPWKHWACIAISGVMFAAVSLTIQHRIGLQEYVLAGSSILLGGIVYIFFLHLLKVITFSELNKLLHQVIRK